MKPTRVSIDPVTDERFHQVRPLGEGASGAVFLALVSGLMKVTPEEAVRASAQVPLVQALAQGAAIEPERAELMHQVEEYICEIARQHPILLTFDDVHHASDADAALITLERYDQLVAETPVLVGGRSVMILPYPFHRGDYEAAAAAGEEYMRNHPPMTSVGWPPVYAITALSYAHLGRPERALEICEHALAHVSPEEREYFVMDSPLEAAYASALALTGNAAKSAEVFRERIERLRAAGEHSRLVVMHHYRARLARLTGDPQAVQVALTDMLDAAAASGNPAVHALAQRLSEERGARSELPPFEADDRRAG